jgi:hypothetical protein
LIDWVKQKNPPEFFRGTFYFHNIISLTVTIKTKPKG